jgi:tetratricopeptide (TPR) repeat protein
VSFKIEDDSKRKPFPRFLPFRIAEALGETSALPNQNLKKGIQSSFNEIEDSTARWREKHSVPRALELAGLSLVLDFQNPDAAEAIAYLEERRKNLNEISSSILDSASPKTLIMSPENFIENEEVKSGRVKISELRSKLSRFPRNPLAWIDLAFFFSSAGNIEKARRAMTIALQTGANNRFVIRSAARFFLHLNEPDRALRLLREADGIKRDPWLMAAEISISEAHGKKSKSAKLGKAILVDANQRPKDVSELGAALATLEFFSGDNSDAKKALRRSLIDPTENAIAQGVILPIGLKEEATNLSKKSVEAFEAKSMIAFDAKKYKESYLQAKKWFRFQPFSPVPAVQASFLAGMVLDEHAEAVDMLTEAIRANPSNFNIRNNLAFSYASLGKLDEAERYLSSIIETGLNRTERAVLIATKGLVAIKRGRVLEGEELYIESIYEFKALNDGPSMAYAAYCLALNSKQGSEKRKISLEIAKEFGKLPRANFVLEKIKEKNLD